MGFPLETMFLTTNDLSNNQSDLMSEYPDTNLLKPHLFVLIVALYAKCKKKVAIEGGGVGGDS